jgi:HEAT repeat protein
MDIARAWGEIRRMRHRTFAVVVLGPSLSLVLAASSLAAPPPPKPPPSPKAPNAAQPAAPTLPADALARLRSGDPAQIKSALDDVRMDGKGGAAAAPVIAELLRKGLDAALTQSAIETLADTEAEAGSEALAWYTHHRTVAVRRAAVSALTRTKGAAAVKALRAALSDGDPQVRGAAATGIGALKAKDAVGDLFTALDHKVNEAAVSIGQLCAGPECERLASKLGQLPFDVVVGGLDQALFRNATDVNDDVKIKIIGRIRELGTGEANKFLKEAQKKWPDAWSKRVKQAIDGAVLATSGAPGAGGTP